MRQCLTKGRRVCGCTVVLLLLLAPTVAGQPSKRPEDPALTRMRSNWQSEIGAGVADLHRRGREAIPLLIAAIDDASLVRTGMTDPKIQSAQIYPWEIRGTEFGVLAAYVVELILARTSLRAPDVPSLWVDGDDYLYDFGRIWTGKHPNGLQRAPHKLITGRGLKEVQVVYQRWWDRNKESSLEDLRAAWRRDHGPLNGSKFFWY
jgi:hypothetical protein